MDQAMVERATQQLRALDAGIRLIVIHPNANDQHALLDLFADARYVRFEGANLTAADLDAQIEAALQAQASVSNADFAVIVLDECDRAQASEIVHVVRQLLTRFSRARVVMLTRTIPQALLHDRDLKFACIPTNDEQMWVDYAAIHARDGVMLEVRALGVGRVLLDGQPIANWDGVLPRLLFFYLVDRGMVTRGEIFETFWPNLSIREATNVFHVTKRKVSEVLGIDLTKYGSSYYHIAPNIHLSYDVALFTQMIQDSAILPDAEAVTRLESALALYRGGFLTGLNADWVLRRRAALRQNYAEALLTLGESLEMLNDLPRALYAYRRAAGAQTRSERSALNAKIAALESKLGLVDGQSG
jgi:hypothetical protein